MLVQVPTTEGERRKEAALDLLEIHRKDFLLLGRRALLLETLKQGSATADCVREAVKLPEGIDPRCFGGVPQPLAKAGIIRSGGFTHSTRPERHACITQVWELADRQAAVDWLAAHPEPQGPPNPDAESASEGFSNPFNNETRQRQLPGFEKL